MLYLCALERGVLGAPNGVSFFVYDLLLCIFLSSFSFFVCFVLSLLYVHDGL